MPIKKQTAYEPPVIVPLGDLAKGSGLCQNGSLHTDKGAPPGHSPWDCISGTNPRNPGNQLQDCAQGTGGK